MVRVVFVGETNKENGFVRHFRTWVGNEATQKSRNGLNGGGLALPQHIPSHGAEGRGQITCMYVMEDTISKVKQAASIQSAEYDMKIHTLEPAH